MLHLPQLSTSPPCREDSPCRCSPGKWIRLAPLRQANFLGSGPGVLELGFRVSGLGLVWGWAPRRGEGDGGGPAPWTMPCVDDAIGILGIVAEAHPEANSSALNNAAIGCGLPTPWVPCIHMTCFKRCWTPTDLSGEEGRGVELSEPVEADHVNLPFRSCNLQRNHFKFPLL